MKRCADFGRLCKENRKFSSSVMTRILEAYIIVENRRAEMPGFERGIERARRTYITAERMVDKHGKENREIAPEHLLSERES